MPDLKFPAATARKKPPPKPTGTTHLSDDTMLRAGDLVRLQIVPFGIASIWRKVASGEFIKPVKLGPRTTAWRLGDVKAWIASKTVQPTT